MKFLSRARTWFAKPMAKRLVRFGPPPLQPPVFTPNDHRLFAKLVERLALSVAPSELWGALQAQMTSTEQQNLYALLHFIARAMPDSPNAALVRRVPVGNTGGAPVKRNILFITSVFPSYLHGGGARVTDFIKHLARHHDVYLYTNRLGPQAPDDQATLEQYCKKIQTVAPEEFERQPQRIQQFVAGIPIDVVHYEWPHAITNYARALGRHHIFTYMEVVSLRLWMDLQKTPLASPEWITRFIELCHMLKIELVDTQKVDARIVVTRKDGEFLARLDGHQPYWIVNHGVNFENLDRADSIPERYTLAFVGNFLHPPNEEAMRFFFQQIYPTVRAQIPELCVLVIGANPPAWIRVLDDQTRILVTGQVADLQTVLQRAAVCIAPLVSGAGLRSKVIWYAALKRACVATHIATEDMPFIDGKEIFIADEATLFAQHVIALLADANRAAHMASAAFVKARQMYDNHTIVSSLGQLYNVLDRHA